MGTYLPSIITLGWGGGPGLWVRPFAEYLFLLNIYPLHMCVKSAYSTSLLLLPVWMDVISLIL